MFVPFDQLPDTARIWIYQADRKLSSEEIDTISSRLQSFTQEWTAHGNPLNASFQIFYNRFVVLAVDNEVNDASGCSIDTSVNAVKEVARQLSLNLLSRVDVAFFKSGEVVIVNLNDLSRKLGDGFWNRSTLVFDHSILTKGEMENNWIVPAGETWLKRYLKVTA